MVKEFSDQYKILDGVVFYFDFDGILSGDMFYNMTEKCLKSAQYGARHSMELLKALGAEINVITGDSSESGKSISSTILGKMPIDEILYVSNDKKFQTILSRHDELGKVYYVADDLYDSTISMYIKTIVPANAHESLKDSAHYVSTHTANDYFLIDVLCSVITDISLRIKTDIQEYFQPGAESITLTKFISTISLTKLKTESIQEFAKIKSIEPEIHEFDTLTRDQFCHYLSSCTIEDVITIGDVTVQSNDKICISDLFKKAKLKTNL